MLLTLVLPTVGLDIGTISSGNSAVLQFGARRIKPSFSFYYLTLSKSQAVVPADGILIPHHRQYLNVEQNLPLHRASAHGYSLFVPQSSHNLNFVQRSGFHRSRLNSHAVQSFTTVANFVQQSVCANGGFRACSRVLSNSASLHL